jgi:hypothetical protein
MPYNVLIQSTLTGDLLPPIQTALQNVVSCSSYNISSQLSACANAMNPREFTSCIVAWTDPAFLVNWATNGRTNVPTSALTKFINVCKAYVSGQPSGYYKISEGVILSPNMTPIAMMDALTAGGSTKLHCEFQSMQYYFGEYNRLTISC